MTLSVYMSLKQKGDYKIIKSACFFYPPPHRQRWTGKATDLCVVSFRVPPLRSHCWTSHSDLRQDLQGGERVRWGRKEEEGWEGPR